MQGSYYSWPERGKMFTKVIQLLNTAIEQNITFSNHISNKIQEDTAFEWTQKGLLRFYYSEMFNTKLGSRRYSTSNKNEQKSALHTESDKLDLYRQRKTVSCMGGDKLKGNFS